MYLFSEHRLEEKVSNLESENQVLRQQAVAISPTTRALTTHTKTTIIQVAFIFNAHTVVLFSVYGCLAYSIILLCLCYREAQKMGIF